MSIKLALKAAGRRIVAEGRHFAIDVAAELDATIKELMDHV